MREEKSPEVCVVIAAKDAADTIGRAIQSALREPEVAEVVVVDDGSSDTTSDVAKALDDGSGRLIVVRFEQNQGPSAARNRAMAVSRAPLIAVLDADDFFFPRRFAAMIRETGWDMIADNIGFIHHDPTEAIKPDRFHARTRSLSIHDFVDGNISRRGRQRGEIGFLKPVMRRTFLEAHALRYDEALRLGEDYDLYLRALVCGARYKVIDHCGYAAVVRSNSLSGRHRTEDLRRLFEAERQIRLSNPELSPADQTVIRRHERHIKARHDLRLALDVKAAGGLTGVARHLLQHPDAVPAVVAGVMSDKLEARRAGGQSEPPVPAGKLRYLLPGVPVAQK
ncbi:glycosyltransferase family 2 protein [Affinirhizobium pseudoryzae]|uniref:glycosyltransferase family 2 protein n=1 Tax=Allorhizobium pseudoryzae TaxID=379684 RepID=UPI0013EAD8A5|nr:glycosyltransferase family 2 protein [Allorhizobium pseudoryzae]